MSSAVSTPDETEVLATATASIASVSYYGPAVVSGMPHSYL